MFCSFPCFVFNRTRELNGVALVSSFVLCVLVEAFGAGERKRLICKCRRVG